MSACRRLRRVAWIALVYILSAGIPVLSQTPEDPQEWRQTHVPAPEFRYAYQHYVGDGWPVDREKARMRLLLFSLRQPTVVLARNRAYAEAQRWRQPFIAAFDETVAFAEKVRASTPGDILALSRTMRGDGRAANDEIAEAILQLAVNRGDYEADFEWAQLLMNGREFNRETARLIIRHLANVGHHAALTDIVRRYRLGQGFDQNAQKAYYWLLRSRDAGLPVDGLIGDFAREIPRAARIEVESWIATGTVVPP